MRASISRSRLFACAFLCLAALLAACGGSGSGGGETPASSPPAARPQATATPAPPPSPAEAEALRHNGQYAEAIDAFRAIAERGAPDQRLAARLALAQTLLQAGQPGAAGVEAQALIRSLPAPGATPPAAPPPVNEKEAQLLLATAQSSAAAPEAALQTYASYLASGGDAAPYAEMDQALLLVKAGRAVEGEQAAETALKQATAPGRAGSFMVSMARALEAANAPAQALDWWNHYFQGTDDPTGLGRVSDIKRQQGDASWVADAQRLLSEYPRSDAAGDALDALDAAKVPVGDYDRGLVDYRHGRPDAARKAFNRYLSSADAPKAASAAFYLAAIDEAAGNRDAAIDGYARSLALDPRSPLASDAHWWRGRLLEQAGRADEAYIEYDAIAAGFPSSNFAPDAIFRRGLVRYLQGRTQEAIDAWQGAAKSASDPEESRRNAFWAGKATWERDHAAGTPLLQDIVAADGSDWYGLRAQAILYPPKQANDHARLNAAVDWTALDAWAAATLGADPNLALESVLLDPHWSVGQALLAAGRVEEGRGELRSLLERHGADQAALYQLARAFTVMRDTELAARAATRLLSSLPQATRLAAPADLYRLAYPSDWTDLLQKAQQEQKAPPLLMLALVRQESYFDPLAGSGAGALGLTQVIPSTGRAIAGDLQQDDFRESDLYRPVVSLRFGASYLSDQLKAFGGNFYYALAAYNGGPGTASDAEDISRGDPDLFVEQLEFSETRLYVRLVSENYARYRQLYAGLTQPELPAP